MTRYQEPDYKKAYVYSQDAQGEQSGQGEQGGRSTQGGDQGRSSPAVEQSQQSGAEEVWLECDDEQISVITR